MAISLFEEPRVDPTFAMAHAKLAQAHFNLGDDVPRVIMSGARERRRKRILFRSGERYQIHAIASQIEDDPDAAVSSYRELLDCTPVIRASF